MLDKLFREISCTSLSNIPIAFNDSRIKSVKENGYKNLRI